VDSAICVRVRVSELGLRVGPLCAVADTP